MTRRVKEFVQIDKLSTLDELIEALAAARAALPDDAQAELSLRGCDVFGRHISISYMRPQTAEEEECDARYADAWRQSMDRRDQERREQASRPTRLRAVA